MIQAVSDNNNVRVTTNFGPKFSCTVRLECSITATALLFSSRPSPMINSWLFVSDRKKKKITKVSSSLAAFKSNSVS